MDGGAASSFWNWFAEQSGDLSFLCSKGDLAQAHSLVKEQLSKIGPALYFEIGVGYRAKHRLSITLRPEDERAVRLFGKEIITAAPDRMQGWEFCLVVLSAQPNPYSTAATP